MSEIAAVRKRLEQALALAHAELDDPGAVRGDDVRRLAAAAMAELRRARAATLAEGHDLVQLVERLRATLALIDARRDDAYRDDARRDDAYRDDARRGDAHRDDAYGADAYDDAYDDAYRDDVGARSMGSHLRRMGA